MSRIRDYTIGEALIWGLALLWYDSLWWGIPLQVLLIPYTFFLKKHYEQREKKQYQRGFHDFLQLLLLSFQAGYSLENACIAAERELEEVLGKEHAFLKELEKVGRGIQMHLPVEQLFSDMAARTGDMDIYQFSAILHILKNMGGNSVEFLRTCMHGIQEKLETEEEISTVLSGKIYEKNLMLLMPFLMLLYLRITNGGYLDVLYHTALGQGILTVSLAGILGCFYWSEYIMKISF